jgi:RNA polymerase sigma factor (sigma-70 family)
MTIAPKKSLPRTALEPVCEALAAKDWKNKCLISHPSAINIQMHEASDMELLRDYDRQGSETAFAALVQRHVNLVYSVAFRHVGIAAHAEEITQAVFVILARKSASLRPDTILEGWLHETTRLTALSFLRRERRRQFREQEAYMQSTLQETNDVSTWNQLAPLLDEAVSRLGKKDRDAVMLRFFKDKNLREVAAALNVNEAAAQRRVHRAVEKLRGFFTKRGIVLPAAVLTTAISANSVQAAPEMLAKAVTATAIAKGATASASTLTLIKGALKIMAWSKTKTAIVVGAVAILATGTTTAILIEHDKQMPSPPPIAPDLPTITQSETLDLQADGTIRFQMDLDDINLSFEPLTIYHFNNSDFVHLDRITDAAGRPIEFTTRHNGKWFHYAVTFNPPIPPGGEITGSMEGTMTGLIQPTGEPGVYEYSMDHSPGAYGRTRRVEVHHLPQGAVLLSKAPDDLEATTNGDQIELRIDRIIPPGGDLAVRYRYQLAGK